MRNLAIALLAVASATALAGSLPRVAPPGPGMPSTSPDNGIGSLEKKYNRRLNEGDSTEVTRPGSPGPSVLYPTPGGAVTDTGQPLSGQAGVLRDPGGGVWNCTAAGCFSPGGTFLPMKKTPPAASPNE